MMVNFIVCGTQKGGTTALDTYLRSHPQICMGNKKEIHFFDNEQFFTTPQPPYEQYHAEFTKLPAHKLVGEATPIYMYWRDSMRRIWEYNPDIKLIVLLRNPIERAYSHWNMERSRNADAYSFWEAITNEERRCREVLPFQHRVYSYIDRGFYVDQIRRIWHYFDRKNVLILKSEDLQNEPQNTLNHICNFLEVDPLKNIEHKTTHATPYSSQMDIREKNYLLSIFKNEIQRLESLLNWDLKHWLEI
jgi:hypothetical protein